jgi:hypothetical protein
MKALCSRVALASATALVVGYWPAHGWMQTQTDNKVRAIVGAWTLNTDLSDKRQEPQDGQNGGGRRQGQGGSGRRGGFGGGGFGRGGFGGGSGSTSSMSPEERQRLRDELRGIMNPPDRLTITETNSMIIITAGDGHVERLTANGKKITDESTKIERKTKWDNDKLVTEISGAGPRKITETYWVDPDHKQLHVSVLLDIPNRSTTVNRVYDATDGGD